MRASGTGVPKTRYCRLPSSWYRHRGSADRGVPAECILLKDRNIFRHTIPIWQLPIRSRKFESVRPRGDRPSERTRVYKGRARALTDEQVAQARERVAVGVPKAEIAGRLKVGRTTLYGYLGKLN